MFQEIIVTKASGEQKPFSEEKLRASLRRAGADEARIDLILDEVKSQLYDGITTKTIYRIAFSHLKKGGRYMAARYHLKQAIMELGPSGFPFEKYVAELLKQQDYKVRTGQILQGHCVSHEIDVLAEKENDRIMIECKYHNYPGISCDVKVALYIYARFKDVEGNRENLPPHASGINKGWLVTNTRFSGDAIQYAACMGLYLLGWDFPQKGSLKEQIDTLGLYPVTCLTSLTKKEMQQLMDRNVVLCKEIVDNEPLLRSIGVKDPRTSVVLKEARQLCGQLVHSIERQLPEAAITHS